jgi:hypothetical protein
MRTRAIMALLLGGWIIGVILVGLMAAQNFWIIDRLLATSLSEPFQRNVAALPVGEARAMLRYVASEMNRLFFVLWGWTEAVLGLALLVMAVSIRNRRAATGVAAMLGLVAAMQFYLTPRIVEMGRVLDFVPREPPPPGLSTFGWLHAAYSILTLVKLAAGFWVAIALLRSQPVHEISPQITPITPITPIPPIERPSGE